MKVVSLNLSTLGTGKYAPLDKTNLANVKWSINWKEVMGEYFNTNKHCRVKCKVISAASTSLNTTNNLGTIRASFSSIYSNINNGLILGVPIITQTADIASSITQFFGTISATTLTVNSFNGQFFQVIGGTGGALSNTLTIQPSGSTIQFVGGTGGSSSSTLTLAPTSAPVAFQGGNANVSSTTLTVSSLVVIPIGSVIIGQGIASGTTITAKTADKNYTMSVANAIADATYISFNLPVDTVLPVGSVLQGTGIASGTTITAQTGNNTYTMSSAQTIANLTNISATAPTQAIPVGSVITGNGISGYCIIASQLTANTYTMSSSQTISTGTSITSSIPSNVCLTVGSTITGFGVSANTTITAQTGPYTYTVSPSQTITPTSLISSYSNCFLYLNTQESFGLSICTPMMNNLNIQFLKPDEQTLMLSLIHI
jgi:hypothetical protein